MTDAAAAEAGGAKRSRKRSRRKHRKAGSEGHGDDASSKQRKAAVTADDTDGDEDETAPSQAAVIEAPPKVKRPTKAADSRPSQAEAEGAGPKLSFYERVNPHKPSARAIPSAKAARAYTISVALPGSIVLNAQSPELQARLAGQIARTCAIFNVDEIVVFDEGSTAASEHGGGSFQSGFSRGRYSKGKQRDDEEDHSQNHHGNGQEDPGHAERRGFDPNAFLARILQYLETPQYLRKALFPMHPDLRLAGLLPPLDCPHHLRFQDRAPYREGVIVDAASAQQQHDYQGYSPEEEHYGFSSKKRKRQNGTTTDTSKVWVNVGLQRPIEVEVPASSRPELGTRVTVRMPEDGISSPSLCSPREPAEHAGLYWGYTVRLAPSLGLALSDAPPALGGAYDLLIGTSERGTTIDRLLAEPNHDGGALAKSYRHAIVVLGGLSGLEDAVERDKSLEAGADEAHALFDVWVNLVEGQGSRTIRTEEALMIALARLKGPLDVAGRSNTST
ncbi:hypothetical protein V8E36_000189 [Tilletia maclaganii]